jgi:hypothetical protein
MEDILSGMKRKQKGQNLDEMVVMAAKEMGKELYAELSLEERKAKLDAMVTVFCLHCIKNTKFWKETPHPLTSP